MAIDEKNERIVKVKTTSGWERISPILLKHYDVFLMFEPDGTPIQSEYRAFMARSDSYINSDGIVEIECDVVHISERVSYA